MKKELLNLALRRNLFYPSAEIYNSYSGFWDYAGDGLKIKENIRSMWRKHLIEKNNAIEISGSNILPEIVFKASGHLDNFNDPVVQCKKCHSFERADKILENIAFDVNEGSSLEEIERLIKINNIKCSKCGNDFSEPYRFNLLFPLKIGAKSSDIAYLRGEACQNIFLSFIRHFRSMGSLPLILAQSGRAYRNEISPRNAFIRAREFEQSDIELFFDPESDIDFESEESLPIKYPNGEIKEEKIKYLIKEKIISKKYFAKLMLDEYIFFKSIGLKDIVFRLVSEDERPFYSKMTFDAEVKTSYGNIEIAANNYRCDYDLKQHQKYSKAKLSVTVNGRKFIPHIFEISMGLDRIVMALLDQSLSYVNNKLVLKLKANIAPYHCAVMPLVKKEPLQNKAKELFRDLSKHFKCKYDEKASIGKRYAKNDELGIRYAITVDFDSLKDNSVTIRDSWTTKQERIKIPSLCNYLFNLINE